MRLIEIQSEDLPNDCFVLSYTANEVLSVEPVYTLDFVCPDPDVDLDSLLGKKIMIHVGTQSGDRYFHSHVLSAYDTGVMGNQYTYTLKLGSWLSFLGENRDCRIFQQMSVPDIVKQVFTDQDLTDFRFDLQSEYEELEYCVQFRESDLNFVKRLLESEGIYFWVDHEADRHTIVISDTQIFDDLSSPYTNLRFLPDGEENRSIDDREGIQRLQRFRQVKPTNVALRDFDFLVPTNRLDSDASIEKPSSDGVDIEYYDYGRGYKDSERGNHLANLQLSSVQARASTLKGMSNVRTLATGQAFTLEGHPDNRRNRRYFVTGSKITYMQDGSDSSSMQGFNTICEFTCLADDIPFHPIRVSVKPSVSGIHSATVVGPEGSEVHTDKHGRIRVHFHWDRYKSTEEDASCWIRVSQAWAGTGWGVLAMPRVGQEVLVNYVDGDLDRPLAVGIVYNGDNPPPYDLPKDIRYTGLVSRSLKHGPYSRASQLTFDDHRGAERVMIHAERDLQCTVERNSATAVGNDKSEAVADTWTTWVTNRISWQDISISFTGLSVSFTGISLSFTGLSASYTGISTSFTGVSTSFTGVSTSFTGVSTSFTGVSTSFTGSSDSFTGCSSSHTGFSKSITGVSASMTGVSKSMTGISCSQTGKSYSETGTSSSVTGTSSSKVGSSCSLTGVSTSITGVSISKTGSSTSFVGCSTSTTGKSISTTGSSVSSTGCSTSVTGMSVGTTGCSSSATGMSKSVTGCSLSFTGFSGSYTGVSHSKTAYEIKD